MKCFNQYYPYWIYNLGVYFKYQLSSFNVSIITENMMCESLFEAKEEIIEKQPIKQYR